LGEDYFSSNPLKRKKYPKNNIEIYIKKNDYSQGFFGTLRQNIFGFALLQEYKCSLLVLT